MEIPNAFSLSSTGAFELAENKADAVRMRFDCDLAGTSLGKAEDMLLGSAHRSHQLHMEPLHPDIQHHQPRKHLGRPHELAIPRFL